MFLDDCWTCLDVGWILLDCDLEAFELLWIDLEVVIH